MKKKMLFRNVFTTTLFCCILCTTACVNEIGKETQEGSIPITFSIKESKSSTKATNNLFDEGDKIGLYAMLPENEIDQKRYIDNLCLTCGSNNTLIPSKDIFYPEGEDATLDFISYYPYHKDGAQTGSSLIPVSIQSNQNEKEAYSQSDFVLAKATSSANSNEAVELEYLHKLTKIKITLTPGKSEDIDNMLKANPRIIATGFYTHAEYDLKKGTFSLTDGTVSDIVSSGAWEKDKDNNLTGKEFIIIPQPINKNQSLQMEWNGRIYSCPMPTPEEIAGSTQYEIKITSMQANSNILSSMIGSIKEWESCITLEKTNNNGSYAALHLSVLSFSQSNVYRVYSNNKPIAEICKEYLSSGKLTSRAVVAYPVKENESTDLSRGKILQLLDTKENINGGIICWDKGKNSFNYETGNSATINEIYFDKEGNIFQSKPEAPINVSIVKYTIRDTKNGIEEYPIVKIGTQYWMQENLRATYYQDGSPISLLKNLGKDPGYFKANDYDLYFYNGEAVNIKGIAPYGWKIPSLEDWDKLNSYISGDASLLKSGEWQFAGNGTGDIAPVENLTMLNIYSAGMWYQNYHANLYKMVGFWSRDEVTGKVPEQTVFFTGQSNEMVKNTTIATNQSYYKGLSIRCIKE